MLERFLPKREFSSYEDFKENYQITVPPDFNFGFDVVDAWAADPDRQALFWVDGNGGEQVFTFARLQALSNQAANFFTDLGVGKGDFVMLILKQRYEYWICAVALHKIGAVVIPATVQLTKKDIIYRNNAAGVSAVVTLADPALLAALQEAAPESPTLRHIVVVGQPQCGPLPQDGPLLWDFTDQVAARAPHFPRPASPTAAGDPFLLYFTSGTTGMPKMVLHNCAYPLGHITTAKYWQRVEDGGLHLTVSDSGWAKFGWGKIYGQWLAGSAVFAYDMDRFQPKAMLSVMERYPITTFCAPPTMYRFMIQEDVKSYDLSSITHYATAGEPLNPEVYNQWKALTGLGILEGFGQSETSVLLANFPGCPPKPGSMGKPAPLYDIAIVDEALRPCDEGIEGHIVVRGVDRYVPPGLFVEYYKDPDLTARVWHDGCYDTGDVAWMDSDGYYWFVGRDDDIIKCSGYRIGPFEVESALLEHPAVVECAVTAAPDPLRGQVVKATVVLARGFKPDAALTKALQDHVKKVTAPYKYPRIVEFAAELPKTIGGKIRRGQIREADRQGQ
jgi:acetyl-CoA synthetase